MSTNLPARPVADASAHLLDRRTFVRGAAALGLSAAALAPLGRGRRGLAQDATPPAASFATPPPPGRTVGAVYAMTNGDGPGNAVVAFGRSDNGVLTHLVTAPTGGLGTGRYGVPSGFEHTSGLDPLTSNHSLILDDERRALFAVNSADGTISTLSIADDYSLSLVGTVDAGIFPTSLALSGNLLVAVLSGRPAEGNPPMLKAFAVADDGALTPVEGSETALNDEAVTKPTDVIFSEDGAFVIVPDAMTSLISVFPIDAEGILGDVVVTPSAGAGSFGGALAPGNVLLMTEGQEANVLPPAFGTGAMSTYAIGDDGALTVISDQVTNFRTAPCWVTPTPDGSMAFVANTLDGTVSSYALTEEGEATLLYDTAAVQVSPLISSTSPIDSAISSDGRFYYQLWGGLGVVTGYAVGEDGSLAPIDGAIGGGLPSVGSQGLAAI